MKFEWEDIKKLESYTTCRAKVIGGWIVNNLTNYKDGNARRPILISESMVFISDPEHKWEITND